jgi:hypothetical protein
LTSSVIVQLRAAGSSGAARARADVKDDLQRAQRRVLAFRLRHGHIHRNGSHWTGTHEQWLAAQRFEQPAA